MVGTNPGEGDEPRLGFGFGFGFGLVRVRVTLAREMSHGGYFLVRGGLACRGSVSIAFLRPSFASSTIARNE
jgi:hypothetical protein